ncbi:MAG: GMC family oxidoreductase [Mesorhizobium sp.]|nr:MAG: GMC family oxidoreductase [Mesorhizobium sp.]
MEEAIKATGCASHMNSLLDVTTTELTCQACVIGSGPAGALVALPLAERGMDVILVEAGNRDPTPPSSVPLAQLDVDGAVDLSYSQALQLGGSSNLWAGRVARMDVADFVERPDIGAPGWPFPLSELSPYYERALDILCMPSSAHYNELPRLPCGWETFAASDQVDIRYLMWSRPAFKVAELVTKSDGNLANLRVLTDAPVFDVTPNGDRRTIESVTVGRRQNHKTIKAQVFVLAAGGIESTRLLLGYARRHWRDEEGAIGRYFSTHPKADLAVLWAKQPVSAGHPLFREATSNGVQIRAGIGLSTATQISIGTLNHSARLYPIAEYKAEKVFESIKSAALRGAPIVNRSARLRRLMIASGKMAFDRLGQAVRLQAKARTFVVRLNLDQHSNAENRLTLSEDCDREGRQLLNLRWRYDPADRRSAMTFLDMLNGVLRAHDVGHLEYSYLRDSNSWPLTAVHSHFLGTTRMSNDPRQGVVDQNCRVHQLQNLFVAGPSVFPRYGNANPFLTIAALSLRLSDHLSRVLGRG